MKALMIDARCLMSCPPTGVGRLSLNLIKSLALNTPADWRIYVFSLGRKNFPFTEELRALGVECVHLRASSKLFALRSVFFPSRARIEEAFFSLTGFYPEVCLSLNLDFGSLKSRHGRATYLIHDFSQRLYPEFFSLKRRLWHGLVRPDRLIFEADKLLFVSRTVEIEARGRWNFVTDKPSFVLPALVALSDFQSIKYSLPKRFVLALSTLEPRKNLFATIAAVEQLRNDSDFSDLELVVVGADGWQNRALRKSLPKYPFVHYLGFVSEGEKAYLLSLASALSYPSFYEGFGLPVLEALSGGCPVAVADRSSLSEFAGREGVFMENSFSVSDLATALKRAVSSRPNFSPALKEVGTLTDLWRFLVE